MTTAFIITLALFICAFISATIKKGELDALKDNYAELDKLNQRKTESLKERDADIIDLKNKIQALIAQENEVVGQFRDKVDELLVANEDLKNQIIEKDKELSRYTAEAQALRQEYDFLKDAAEGLSSRIITVHRTMPSELNSSRKAERLSVYLRKYMTETPTGVQLQIVVPFDTAEPNEGTCARSE